MIERHQHGSVSWIDMLSPTAEEIRAVMDEYDIDPELTTDLRSPVIRSGAVMQNGAIKVTLDFPVVKYTDTEHQHEIKFIITDDTLITVRYADIVSVHKFSKEFEVADILSGGGIEANGGTLFVALMAALYDSFGAKLDYVVSKLGNIEEEIFNEREKEMVFEISKVSRRLLVFRQTLVTHSEVLGKTTDLLVTKFGERMETGAKATESRFYQLSRRVAALTDSLEELRKTNDSLLETKQNETMKVLTIMAFVTYPLTLLSSLFGMNTEWTPLIGVPGDFWFIIGIMSVAAVGFFVFFKMNRWL